MQSVDLRYMQNVIYNMYGKVNIRNGHIWMTARVFLSGMTKFRFLFHRTYLYVSGPTVNVALKKIL